MNWHDISAFPTEGIFRYNGRMVFKKFNSILKFHEPGLAPVADESGWYHITSDGLPLYSERYLRAFGFYCGLAAVTANDGCFHVTVKGLPLYAERYAWCGNFQEGFCPVCDKVGRYYHIDTTGKRSYANDYYLYAGDFHDGIACVKCGDGLWRHITSKGDFLNGTAFLDIGVFHKGIAPGRDDDGWFHMTEDGRPLYSDRYLTVEPFYNGLSLVTRKDNTKIVIDENGKCVHVI